MSIPSTGRLSIARKSSGRSAAAATPATAPAAAPASMPTAAQAWDLRHMELWAASPRDERARTSSAPLSKPTLERTLRTSDQIADLSRAEPARALGVAHAFVEMARSTGERAIVAVARRCRGHVHRRLGRYREALRDYDASRRELAELGYHVEAARTDIGAVDALGHMGREAEAHRTAKRARGVLARAGEEGRVARLDVNLALLAERAGRPREALAAYRRAEAVFERLGARTDLALTRFNHANALVTLDRYREALALYRFSADVWSERGATTTLCRCRLAEGSILFRLGRLDEALAIFEETREAAALLGDPELEATAALDLARAELLMERLDHVKERLDTAIRGFEALAMQADQAEALGLRGSLRTRTGRPEEALSDWGKAGEIYRALGHRRGRAYADFWRAAVLARLGKSSESRALLRGALRTLRADGSAIGESEARLLLAEQEIVRRPREAGRHLALVAQRARALRDPWIGYRLSLIRARLALRTKIPREARRDLERAYATARRLQAVLPMEELQAHWIARRSELFDLALDPGVLPADTGARRARRCRWLLQWSERARVPRAGLSAIATGADAAAARDPDLAAFEAVREELHWLDAGERARRFTPPSAKGAVATPRGLAQWRRHRAEAISRLERHSRRLEIRAAARGRGWSYAEPDPEAIQKALAPGEVLVEYFARGSELVTLVVSRHSIEAVASNAGLEDARESAHRLRQLWNRHRLGSQFSRRHDETLSATAFLLLQRLGDALFAPALPHIPAGTRRLVISPHAWLRTIPFHALPGPRGTAGDAWEVRYTLSGQWLAEAPAPERVKGLPLVVGLSSPDAPEAESEARAVSRLHAGSTLLVGKAATPTAVRERWSEARVIHVAAHGGIQMEDPRLSGLPLAGGTWGVHEIRGVDTRADLVVLSSCQSGETVLWGTDYHVGLLPALFESGARAAVVSLWPADDAATGILMSAFHHELVSGKTIGEALRAARNVIRSVKSSPYYWAPFVFYGAEIRRGTST